MPRTEWRRPDRVLPIAVASTPDSAGAAADEPRRTGPVLPRGTLTVGVWVGVSGVLAYLYLAITGRALGAQTAAGLSTLWVVGFLLGNAVGTPVEQEVSRAIASRRARGLGVGPVVRRAGIASGACSCVVAAGILLAGPVLARELFAGDWVLVAALAVMFIGTMLEFLVRGVLAGEARFNAYGRLLGVEAATRVVGVAGFALAGVQTAGPYAIVLAFAPFVGIAAALVGADRAITQQAGPEAPWGELSRALGWLLGASMFSQALVNLGPVFVRVLSPSQSAVTSAFVASLIVARVPVFLFQAAQAVLVPRLSHHAGGGRGSALAAETAALVRALLVLVVVGTIGAALLGPTVVRIGWGPDFAMQPRDFALLGAASCCYLIAATLSSALIALELPNRGMVGWLMGVLTLTLCVALGADIVTRVEIGFLAGTAVASVAMGALLWRPLRVVAGVRPRAG